MKLELKRSPGDTPYCVPAALALLTQEPVSEMEKALHRYLGDEPISGILFPLALAVLTDRNIAYREVFGPRKIGLFLCFTKSHAFVMADGTYYDNSFPTGSKVLSMPRVQKCFEITR